MRFLQLGANNKNSESRTHNLNPFLGMMKCLMTTNHAYVLTQKEDPMVGRAANVLGGSLNIMHAS